MACGTLLRTLVKDLMLPPSPRESRGTTAHGTPVATQPKGILAENRAGVAGTGPALSRQRGKGQPQCAPNSPSFSCREIPVRRRLIPFVSRCRHKASPYQGRGRVPLNPDLSTGGEVAAAGA